MDVNLNYANYDIQIEAIPDYTVPNNLSVNITTLPVYTGASIVNLTQVKSIYNENLTPLNSLILTQISEMDYHVFSNSLVLIELTVIQNEVKLYKNIYKILEVNELPLTPGGFGDKEIQILMESVFVFNLKNDNTFYKLNKEGSNPLYNKDIFNSILENIQKNYGSSISSNVDLSGYCKSIFTNYYFNSSIKNIDQIKTLLTKNRVSLHPIIFGIDEGFTSMSAGKNHPNVPAGTSSEISLINLNEIDSVHFPNPQASEFLTKSGFNVSSPIFVENLFSQEYVKNMFHSIYRYTNTSTNKTFDLEPIKNSSIRYESNGTSLPVINYINDNLGNIFEDSGNLIMNDVKAFRENLYKFVLKEPKIYKVQYFKAPYDVFKLGRKSGIKLPGVNISVAADLQFSFQPDEEIKPGDTSNKSNHVCSGVVYYLNWQ